MIVISTYSFVIVSGNCLGRVMLTEILAVISSVKTVVVANNIGVAIDVKGFSKSVPIGPD